MPVEADHFYNQEDEDGDDDEPPNYHLYRPSGRS